MKSILIVLAIVNGDISPHYLGEFLNLKDCYAQADVLVKEARAGRLPPILPQNTEAFRAMCVPKMEV